MCSDPVRRGLSRIGLLVLIAIIGIFIALALGAGRPLGSQGAAVAQDSANSPPWKINKPIVTVEKTLNRKRPKGGGAVDYSVSYIGPKLERMEISNFVLQSDIAEKVQQRISSDNGRTWGPYQDVPVGGIVHHQGVPVTDGYNYWEYNPHSGAILQTYLRQVGLRPVGTKGYTFPYDGCHNFTYYRFTFDRGKTWSPLRQFRYEPGDEFDPKNVLKPAALHPNQGYGGQRFLFHSNGTVIFGLVFANNPHDPENDKRPFKMGSVLMIGKWDPGAKDYRWDAGARVEIKPGQEQILLMEPDLAELTDGRILVVWRASNRHRVFSVSRDGGRTLSPIRNWKYDDGTDFFSPASLHRFLRHSVTKKLYWFGNICDKPPQGDHPRYPLVIAEVDDTIPALKKNTVSAIDDRQPGQSEKITFSNFCLLEDRETHQIELYLPVYGESPEKPLDADNYRYRLSLK